MPALSRPVSSVLFIEAVNKSSPDVIETSCHSVKPKPNTIGVFDTKTLVSQAARVVKKEEQKKVNEQTNMMPKASVPKCG